MNTPPILNAGPSRSAFCNAKYVRNKPGKLSLAQPAGFAKAPRMGMAFKRIRVWASPSASAGDSCLIQVLKIRVFHDNAQEPGLPVN